MTDAKLLRFGAVVIVFAAYLFIFRTGEVRIAERLGENVRIVERQRSGERALAERPQLERRRTRLRDALREIDLDAGRSALVARFLRAAARIAAAHHSSIVTVAAAGPAAAVTPIESKDPFDAIPLELTVEGRYADVLATMRALSASRVLAAVDVASLARKHADGADATLTAALHIVLERGAPAQATPAGSPDVRTGRG